MLAHFLPGVLSAASRPPCAPPEDRPSAVRKGRNRRMNVGSICLMSVFSQPVATGSFSASCQEESEDKSLQRQWGKLHPASQNWALQGSFLLCLDLWEEFLPLPVHLEHGGSIFQCFSSGIWFRVFCSCWFWLDFFFPCVKHAQRGWYMLSRSHTVSNAVWLCIHHDPKIITVILQVRMAFSGSMSEIFTNCNGPCRWGRMQVKVASLPAWQVSYPLQIPL